MKLVKYSPLREMERIAPWRELERFEERMSRLFGEFFPLWGREREEEGAVVWEPAVDIYETDKEFVLKAELPEIDSKDVHVSVEGNMLTIHGERKQDKEVKRENYHRTERYYGSFTRSFVLPDAVHREGITATFKDGMMKLTMPKKAEVKPKEIKIEAA